MYALRILTVVSCVICSAHAPANLSLLPAPTAATGFDRLAELATAEVNAEMREALVADARAKFADHGLLGRVD